MRIADIYRKDIWNQVAYLGEDNDLRSVIGDTIGRLPDDALLLAADRCVFVSVGRTVEGMTLPGDVLQRVDEDDPTWLILLDDRIMDTKEADDVESVIAHEIAHAFLGHNRMTDDGDRSVEIATCKLVREWGFEGSGTDESRHH
ncbi:MAG: hypothetical protein E6J43_12440 [Chloroflexi bacterium]|nr:MAG: hypothetical protein E6J43_12440 [Chloroflexota bacterium]